MKSISKKITEGLFWPCLIVTFIFVGRALPPEEIIAIFEAGSAGICKQLPR